jgi:hypothetical protein
MSLRVFFALKNLVLPRCESQGSSALPKKLLEEFEMNYSQ